MERKQFTTAYKEHAVKLTREGGRTVQQVADELRINVANLWRWRRKATQASARQTVLPDSGTPREADWAALKQRVRELEMECDILKKAAIYLAQTSQ
jgi:transposase